MMKNTQVITGGPSYSRDLWDTHGLKMIHDRIDKAKKSMKHLRDFFQDSANMSFRNASTTHKLQGYNVGGDEFGTLKFVEDRYCELIETMSKNEQILGSKVRTQCYQKLNDQITRISKVNTKILSDLNGWQKNLEREQKKLRKAKQSYDDKKRQSLAVMKALKVEKEHLNTIKGNHSQLNKAPQIESNIMSLQQKCKHMQSQSREQLENYIRAVSHYRGFRLKYDSCSCILLDQLEQTEVDRAQMVHRILKLYLEIQQVMVQQSLRNIDTISKHIANIDAHSDNMVFVEKYRSNQKKPALPDPKFHADDEVDAISTQAQSEEDNIEESAQVLFWCEKWRLVIGKILERDIELVSPKTSVPNSNDVTDENADQEANKKDETYAFIQLTDDEYKTLRDKCMECLNTTYGRTAFSLIINRQRNTEYGLELKEEQFEGLVELILLFFDSIQTSHPLDIKPAKLVMIMSQSLYVKKENITHTNENDENVNKNIEDDEDDSESKTNEEPKQHTSDKLFIGDRIKHHDIWKNDKFWKEAYCDSVQQEILKYPAVKKWHSEHEQHEAERREEQIIFSQLAAWTHNMKEFGTEDHKILHFLNSRGLKADQIEVLKATLHLTNEQPQNIDNANNLQAINGNNNNNLSTFETATGSTSPASSVGLP